jgi:predicted AAA+ superfamily ATPase
MIPRTIHQKLLEVAGYFPVVTVTGPRQSGKTTLIQAAFPNLPYVLLEQPNVLLQVREDPLGFLANYPQGAILDEVQNVPELFSYLQGVVDGNPAIKFVLSGSQNFLLLDKITQTLAGRTAVVTLLPLSLAELQGSDFIPESCWQYVFNGSYPRIYQAGIPPAMFYPSYLQTYVERDVRSIQNIGDLSAFSRFLQLCAGRIGQILNVESLSNDAGISQNTAKSWLSVLEASYVIYLLQPHHSNFNKRVVKRPKLFFYDTGLACNMLQIEHQDQLANHHARGALFENFVLNEMRKMRLNHLKKPNLYFWRDNKGVEVDCIIEHADSLIPVEIKSGQTYQQEFFKNLGLWNKWANGTSESSYVVYGGAETLNLNGGKLISWQHLEQIPVL